MTTPIADNAGSAGATALTSDSASASSAGGTGAAGAAVVTPGGGTSAAAVDPKVAAAAATPAEIELKLPAGIAADDAMIGKFKPLAKELGLKSDGAQKLVDMFSEARKGAQESAAAEHAKTLKGWGEALKSDKEFGGADFDKNSKVALRTMTKFATPELRKFLEDTGLGNHPELVRLAYRVGKALGEDSVAGTSGNGAAAANPEEAFHRLMYPSMFKGAS